MFPLGIFVALALRFDVSRRRQPQYFTSAFVGYAVGVVLTIVVMNWFQAAQVSFCVLIVVHPLLLTNLGFFLGFSLMSFGLCFASVSACFVIHCPSRNWVLGFSLHLER